MYACKARFASLVVIVLALACVQSALAAPLPFSDGFESIPVGWYPNANGWRTWLSGVTAYVSNQAAHSGSRSFRLHSYPSWSRCDYLLLEQVPDRFSYQAAVRMDPIPGREAWVGLAGVVSQMVFHNFFAIRSEGGSIGTVYFVGAAGVPPLLLGHYSAGQWITIQADLNFVTLAADLWLDGTHVAAAVPIQPKAFYDPLRGPMNLSRFAVGECNWIGGGTGVIYLDDVTLVEFAPPAIDTIVDMAPDTLNLRSKGNYVVCYIELPEGYSVADIVVASLLLNGQVAPEPRPAMMADYDYDGTLELAVKFSRAAVASLLRPGRQELTLTGELADGTLISGSDVIRVLR